jgi:hypothetical protein
MIGLMMDLSVRLVIGVTMATTAAIGLLACAGSTSSPVVVKVDGTPVTRATLSHWMSVIVAGDNLEHVGHPAPPRLVSDPPNKRACGAAIASIGPAKDAMGESKRVELQCHQLYEGIKEQTLSFLIQGVWTAREASDLGIEVSERDVEQRLAKTRAEGYPTDAAFEVFLRNSGLALSDERALIRRDLLAERLEAYRRRLLSRRARGRVALERALLGAYAQSRKRWSARTRCSATYAVPECGGSHPTATTPSPAVVLEQIAASRSSERG